MAKKKTNVKQQFSFYTLMVFMTVFLFVFASILMNILIYFNDYANQILIFLGGLFIIENLIYLVIYIFRKLLGEKQFNKIINLK